MSISRTLAADTRGREIGEGLSIGVIVAETIFASLVQNGLALGELASYPETVQDRGNAFDESDHSLVEMPTETLVAAICDIVERVAGDQKKAIEAIGVALPGLIANGTVSEAPNLPQLKGADMASLLSSALAVRGISARVQIVNDADAIAAGLASKYGKLDHFIRVWTLGTGIGYGMYPFDSEGVWEGGHCVVSLDDKETFCGCGGRGHLEGIMGHRAMRLRFLDMEPEEVFEAANRRQGADQRCVDFKRLWHKSLAAATATSIHLHGAGRFFITGYNVRFLDLGLLKDYLHQMVKMSPIQGYSLEVVPDDQLTRVIGAAVAAEQK